MSLQLLCRVVTGGFDNWKRAFDDGGEARDMAGLTLMQMWREADQPDIVWMVFSIASRDKARAFVDGPEAAFRDSRSGASASDWHFVEPAF